MVLLAGDEGVSGDDLPVFAGGVLEIDDWAGEGVESPIAFDDAGDGVGAGNRVWGGLRGDGGMVRCRLGPAGLGFGYGIKREGLAVGRVGEDEASLIGVRRDRNVSAGSWAVEVEDEVVGEGGGEDQGRAFNWKGDAGFEEAGDGGGVGGTEGRRDGGLDGGEADDDDGFGVVEGGRGVEAQVEGVSGGEGDGGDVLVFGGVETAHEADEVDDGADVGGVHAGTHHLGVAGLVDEVGTGAVSDCCGDGGAVAVVEEGLGSGLGEAGGLGVDGFFEAVAVGLEVEGAGEEVRVLGEGLGVVWRDATDVGEVGFDAGLLESCFEQILRGADEDAGAAADGGAEGGEVSSGFGCEEEDDLLGLVGDGDSDALFADFFVPGLDVEEPVVGGRVGGAAEEGGNEEVVDGLGGREVGAEPDLVAGEEIGHLGDGEGAAIAGDVNVDFGASEVEARGVGVEGGAEEKSGESSDEARTKGSRCHHSILDGWEPASGLAGSLSCNTTEKVLVWG